MQRPTSPQPIPVALEHIWWWTGWRLGMRTCIGPWLPEPSTQRGALCESTRAHLRHPRQSICPASGTVLDLWFVFIKQDSINSRLNKPGCETLKHVNVSGLCLSSNSAPRRPDPTPALAFPSRLCPVWVGTRYLNHFSSALK